MQCSAAVHCTASCSSAACSAVDALSLLQPLHSNSFRPSLPSPAPAATLDLHFLSVMGCRVVLRAWLLHLKRSALAGHALAPDTPVRIVTGTHAACAAVS